VHSKHHNQNNAHSLRKSAALKASYLLATGIHKDQEIGKLISEKQAFLVNQSSKNKRIW
jgi:hypothetical protein